MRYSSNKSINFNGGDNLMVFRACQDMKDASGRVIVGYTLSNQVGEVKFMTNKQIKDLINSGNVVIGLKIDKAGRLIKDKNAYSNIDTSLTTGNRIQIYTGKALLDKAKMEVQMYNQRNYVRNIVNFCINRIGNRLMLVHGVRRTGKTVQIKHAILECFKNGIQPDRVYFLQIGRFQDADAVTSVELDRVIREIIAKVGNPIIFIDEITFVKDVITYLNRLQDIYTEAQFVLTGTDSFVFSIAQRDSIYGRCITIHSQYIGYKEFRRLMPKAKLADYMEGGTLFELAHLSYSDAKNIKEQTYGNIIGTIERSKDYFLNSVNPYIRYITEISRSDLMYIIFNVLASITSPKDNRDIVKAMKQLGKQKIAYIQNATDIPQSEIISKSQELTSSKVYTINYVIDILQELDIIRKVSNLAYRLVDDTQVENEKFDIVTESEICCLINNIAYTLCSNCIHDDSVLKGVITENVVLSCLCMLQAKKFTQNNKEYSIQDVGYLKYSVNGVQHEVDAIVTIKQGIFHTEYDLIEVKSGDKIRSDYTKHLNLSDKDFPSGLRRGKIRNKIVIYNGISCEKYGVQFVNLEEFLLDPCKWL